MRDADVRDVEFERMSAEKDATIPGVGPITAISLLAVIGDVARVRAPAIWSAISGSIHACASRACPAASNSRS
jgi:hypothetical protein